MSFEQLTLLVPVIWALRVNQCALFTRFEDGIVEIHVGSGNPPGAIFHVHKHIIIKSSPFFQNMLKGGWQEAETRVVKLPEDDLESIRIYLNWLYSGKIQLKPFIPSDRGADNTTRNSQLVRLRVPAGAINRVAEDDDNDVKRCEEHARETYALLAKTIVFGDKLLDERFSDAAIDAFSHCSDSCPKLQIIPGKEVTTYLYENTPPHSKVRPLLVRLYFVSRKTWDQVALEDFAGYPPDFMTALAAELLRLKGSCSTCRNWTKMRKTSCNFHDHSSALEEETKCRKGKRVLRTF